RVAAGRVERHVRDRGPVRVVVAERVDMGGCLVRRDDDLRVERGAARRGVRVLDVAEDLRRREEGMQLRLTRERLGEVDNALAHLTPDSRARCRESDTLDRTRIRDARWRTRSRST